MMRFIKSILMVTMLAHIPAALTAEDQEEIQVQDYILGDPDAEITITEYASITCPHCQNFHLNEMPEFKTNYIDTGKVQLIYREVYFNGADILGGSLARCLPEDQYFPMIDMLYQNDETWLRSQSDMQGVTNELVKMGLLAGMNKDDLAACLDDRDQQGLMVEYSQANMEADKVTGTPTLLLDGKKIDPTYEALSKAVEKAME